MSECLPDGPVEYLLFGGQSADGCSAYSDRQAKFLGRTTDAKRAMAHLKKVEADPYATGGVYFLSDQLYFRIGWTQTVQEATALLRADPKWPEFLRKTFRSR